ncbi:MAG: CAP domain-containing protein [Proteobacteria bacterium]|nr:CAP domain-containing protein [Pseudomonadota bacterium]
MRILVFLPLAACAAGSFVSDELNDSESGADSASDSGTDTAAVRDVCTRWTTDRAALTEGSWSGSVNSCNAGDISADGRESALRLVNLYRWLADLPPVTTSATKNTAAQDCALMMHANDDLSHNPPTNWSCYTDSGATAAGRSNISSGPGTMSVDMYMIDPGNSSTLGHRRWILSNSAGPIGLGSTSESSCMHVLSGSGNAGAQWTAWPPPGGVPLEAFTPGTIFWSGLDETGWSVQSDSIDLTNASVTVTRDGQALSVNTSTLQQGYGSATAIAIRPQGWATQAGRYTVSVDAAQSFSYDVDVVDCD